MSSTSAESRRPWPASAVHDLLTRPANQLPALDGLRAAAVLFVICDHWVYEWVTIAHHAQPAIARLPMFYWGWTGVDLFFVLSGFLIGKQLWSELYRTGTINVGSFILRRGLRIWPLYYATMIFFVVIGAERAPSWPDWFMLSNYVQANYGRSWSLSTEEQFYLVMPTLLLLFHRVVKQRFLPACIAGLLVMVAGLRAWTFATLSGQALDPKQISTMMYTPFHLHAEPLLIGLLVAWIALRRPGWLKPADDGRFAARAVGASMVAAMLAVALRMANREVFAYLALGVVYGAGLCIGLADRSFLTAVLRWKVWYYIARLSFGMYLNHLMLREPTDTILAIVSSVFPGDSTVGFLAGLVLTVLASAATAAVTFLLIEQPGLAWRDQWMARRRAEQTAASTAAAPS